MASRRFEPSSPLRGALRPPADKSISHRAALIAAMGEGEAKVVNYLEAADTIATMRAVEALGARVERIDGTEFEPTYLIKGVGLHGANSCAIDVGNAGTLLRLLPGWLAGQVGREWTLDGDDSIRQRPVDRIVQPLRRMGARLDACEDRLAPLRVSGEGLHGIEYEMPVASAQVKSCLLFAGLLATGETRVIERLRSRDHTERMLMAAGADVELDVHAVVVRPADRLEPGLMIVPGDLSSAAFFIVAATLIGGSDIVLRGVGVNPTRMGLIAILRRMGATITVDGLEEVGGEPIADLRVSPAPLIGTEVADLEVPFAIDELPLVALAACFAEGTTTIRDAAELRHKESDRVATVAAALNALSGSVEPTEDGMAIEGTGGLRGGAIHSHGDHRIAMLGAIAGLASREGVEVDGIDSVAVSYPGFEADLASLSGR